MSNPSLLTGLCLSALSLLLTQCGSSDQQQASNSGTGGSHPVGGVGGYAGNSQSTSTGSTGQLGEVVTLAGTSETSGSDDGPGALGLMRDPEDLVSDGSHIYLVEGYTVNRILSLELATGAITVLAGDGRGSYGDGIGTAAKFDDPEALTIDPSHQNLYVADTKNFAIRKIVIATGEVTTIAGTLLDGYIATVPGSQDGIGNAASFKRPTAITIDSKGTHLYVADADNHEIRSIDLTTNEVTTLAGSTTAGSANGVGSAASFDDPEGLAIDPTDTKLYVADSGNNVIRVVDIASRAVTTLPVWTNATGTAFNKFRGLTIDSTGTYLYATEGLAHVVDKIEIATPKATTLAGSNMDQGFANGKGSDALFDFPEGLMVSGNSLYVADSSNNQIRKIDLTTTEVTTFAGSRTPASFAGPRSVTSDGTSLYVADTGNNSIRKVSSASGYTTTIAGSPSTDGHADGVTTAATFYNPSGIASDGTNLYIADAGNYEIRKLVLATGEVSTLAGSYASSGATDGVGSAASFSLLQGIAIDPSGKNLYVADQDNHEIRKVVIATGEVTTLAGSTQSGFVDGTGTAARFNMPANLVVEPSGSALYVTDGENNAIRKITLTTAAVTTLAGSATAGHSDGVGTAASFDKPWGIATDGTYVYVADAGNNMIRKIELSTATVTTLSGSYTNGSADGPGPLATFSKPAGIMLDATGSFLYVCDSFNDEIRRVRVK